MLLEVEAVNTFRGPAHILRGVTLEVGDGEVVSLVGRNGAGRTTIIESITGLLPVRSGRIRFRGEDITRLPPHKRAKRGIGYAPENSGIFPDLTVAEARQAWPFTPEFMSRLGDGLEIAGLPRS